MPIIPLPQRSNPLPNAPAPVLDRERRPTVDNRGLMQAVDQFADATKMPDVPMSMGNDPGLQAIGKALGQAGNVVGALAIKMKEAQSDKQVADWDSKMEAVRADFEGWKMKNPDPATWGEEWQKRLGQIKTEFGEDQKLNHGAREQIGLRLTRYEGMSSADVLKEAAKETFRQARSASDARIMRYTEAQDEAAFQAEIKNRREKGYSYEHEDEADQIRFKKVGEQKQKEAKAEAERVEYETEVSIAIVDPNKWLAENKEPWKDRPILWQRVKNAADARKNEGTAEMINDLQNDIITGNITWPTEIDALQSPFLTPELRENAKNYLANRNEYQERQDRETNGVRNAVELRKRVAAYDPAQDPDRTQYFELAREITTRAHQSMAGELTSDLSKKYGVDPGDVKVRPEIQRNVSKTLDVIFDSEVGAIPWRKKVPVLDSKGKQVKDENGNPKATWEEDQAAKQKAIDAQTVIESKMADWFKENPGATLPEVRKKVNELLPEGTEAAFFMNMKKGSAQASGGAGTVTSYGYANDSTPDSNSSAGIGAWVPKAEQEKIKRGEASPYKLREGDIAVSPDVEKAFRAAGVKPGDEVLVQLADGQVRRARWMDRTAQDEDILKGRIKGVTKPLRGRFDFYSPRGKDAQDGMKVVKWWVPDEMPAIPARVAQS